MPSLHSSSNLCALGLKKIEDRKQQKSVEQVYNWIDQTDVCFNDIKT